jgi:uncharacterized hydrophobic protein (TIGR00271 family)
LLTVVRAGQPRTGEIMSLHVRVVSPAGLTDRLAESLAANPGVRNLLVLRGSTSQPDGDAVHFDVLTLYADPAIRHLRALGLDRPGGLMVGDTEVAIGAADQDGHRGGLVNRAIAPVWDVVEARIRAQAVYPYSFFILLAIAGLIGAVGILTNSQILVVGAMVVGPEYSAIMGVALGADRRDGRLAGHGIFALIAGFAGAIVIILLFGLAIRGSGHTPAMYADGVRPVSDLVNSPNLFSLVVAVLAGIVGVVSLTEARAGTLIGVFISVTTIPAAADTGLSIAYASWSEARGSALQLLLNVVVLIVIGALGLRLQRIIWHHLRRAARSFPAGEADRAAGR